MIDGCSTPSNIFCVSAYSAYLTRWRRRCWQL